LPKIASSFLGDASGLMETPLRELRFEEPSYHEDRTMGEHTS
jgi:hypothetical protein